MYDGEGHLTIGKRNKATRSVVSMGISQRKGPVLERAKNILLRAGFVTTGFKADGTTRDVMNLQIMGGLHERLRALGIFCPIRLMDKLVNSDCDFEVWLRPDPIVRIEPIGPVELLSIETTTGTFLPKDSPPPAVLQIK